MKFPIYLCNRSQNVRYNNYQSSNIVNKFGVPQVLGPILLILYINDIVKLKLVKYDTVC